jgi:hypothetical protein
VTDKAFILQRICIYAGKQIDPNSDLQVKDVFNNVLGIKLPQRRTLNESLEAANHEHEIIGLITKNRNISS